MATANNIISGALRKAGIKAAESPITESEFADGLDLLNDTFSELEESVLSLGFQPVPNGASEVRMPRGAVNFAKGYLAMRMVSEYRIPMPVGLPAEVDESMRNVMMANRQNMATSYPDNLPIGSGSDDDLIRDSKFYAKGDKVNF